MIAVEHRTDKRLVDRSPVCGFELSELLAPLLKRWRAFTGPDHGVECKSRHHLRVTLGKHRRAQRARGDSVDQKRALSTQFLDVEGGRVAVISALRNRRIVIAVLRRAS